MFCVRLFIRVLFFLSLSQQHWNAASFLIEASKGDGQSELYGSKLL